MSKNSQSTTHLPALSDFPYRADSAALFERLLDRRWPVFLDSGPATDRRGRYDILSADPRQTLITSGGLTRIGSLDGECLSSEDPLRLVQAALGTRRAALDGLPFAGGAIGYFGYDLARRLMRLPELAHNAERLPEMAIGIYDWALVVDHHERRAWMVEAEEGVCPQGLFELGAAPRRAPYRIHGPIETNLDRAAHLRALVRIKEYLRAGDCYQVNLARRFAVEAEGDPWTAYRVLRQFNAAPFGAYLHLADVHLLSSSPERFLRVRDAWVETCPIKGTRARGATPYEDQRLAEELRASPKDRAENLMIVDLLRNDLGRVCATGSMRVPALFEVERFARVQHLVSRIEGRLAPGQSALDLLRAAFPGGSITGAPKQRAMEIIEELEPHRRGLYCGAIGYLGFDGGMDTNIAIRTLVHHAGIARFWSGGGIVIDSDPRAEYRETGHKAEALWELLTRHRDPMRRGAYGYHKKS
ncbi:MAG: aminodeoxychorismate synthase component I [Chromatiaceae bacterium]|nr:aminodeoxychorismate synthase component I [Chromatiaceae bacterium]